MRNDTHGRNHAWRTGAVLLGLAASLAQAAAPEWSVPRDARIEKLEARIEEGHENDYMKEHCDYFTLTAEETLVYLRSAQPLPMEEVHERVDWTPCIVRGTLVSGKGKRRKEVRFDISATLAAHIYEPGKPLAYLVCEGTCEERMNKIIEKHVHGK